MVGAGGAPSASPTAGRGTSLSRLTAAPPGRPYQLPQPQPSPPLQLPSPQAQLSPSTVEASPLLTSAPRNVNVNGNGTGHVVATGRQMTEKARASIACTRCRRNKTRCRNKNDGSPCEACEERGKGRECDYTIASLATASASYPGHRRESATGEIDNHAKKQRKRPIAPTSRATHSPYDIVRVHEDVLDSPCLTPKVWEELFDIYEKHFATDFPFLHRRRFTDPLKKASLIASGTNKPPRPPHSPPLLLAFLAQTARHHPDLVTLHGSKPIAAADFFANATQRCVELTPGDASLENTQALLFLGFHRWTALNGSAGWLLIRSAGAYAQCLGYQNDEEREKKAAKEREERVRGHIEKTDAMTHNDPTVQQESFLDCEIQRRTFWSCFIMDRWTSCGKKRPQLFDVNDIETQLPCSETAFSHGQRVRTRMLGETDEVYAQRRQDEDYKAKCARDHHNIGISNNQRSRANSEAQWEVGKDEGELSLYIEATDYFGRVSKWSNATGRRGEKFPPWDIRSGFKRLEEENQKLHAALPRHLILSPYNTDNHLSFKTSRNYMLIHALLSLSTIALYREYMAFLPWNVTTPIGPRDEPRITEELPADQQDYWITQARKCFGAAKDFADLLRPAKSANALVDSPIVGWATYIVAWCALYCAFFPRMDPDRALDHRARDRAWELVNDIIFDMSNRFIMASQWSDFLARLHIFFKDARAEWKSIGGSPESTTSDSGGGLKVYAEKFESAQKEFGSLDTKTWCRTTTRDDLKLEHDHDLDERGEVPNPIVYKTERTPVSTPTPKFNAVNSIPITASETHAQPSYGNGLLAFGNYSDPVHMTGGHHGPYSTGGNQSTSSLAPESTATSPTYDTGPMSYRSVQANRVSYPGQSSAVNDGSAPFWTPQQRQQLEQNSRQMELAGQHSMGMEEFQDFQLGTNFVGFDNVCMNGSWPEQVPHYNYGIPHEGYVDPNHANPNAR